MPEVATQEQSATLLPHSVEAVRAPTIFQNDPTGRTHIGVSDGEGYATSRGTWRQKVVHEQESPEPSVIREPIGHTPISTWKNRVQHYESRSAVVQKKPEESVVVNDDTGPVGSDTGTSARQPAGT